MIRSILLQLAVAFLLLTPQGVCAAPRSAVKLNLTPDPTHRIPLEHLGFRASTSLMWQRENFVMQTVEYVDDDHVMVTWNARKLIPRVAEGEDRPAVRLVHAAVLHLPEGRVVHETEWRTHDRNRYLWPLGRDEFLLRLRESLYVIHPLRGSEGFERTLLLRARADIEEVEVSPDGRMILVETVPQTKVGDDPTSSHQPPKVTATFYSLRQEPQAALHQRLVLEEEHAFTTPFTARGFLTTLKEDRSHWGFDFQPLRGKPMELAGFLSTCEPRADFLSESTFLATGCRGQDDRRLLAGFDLSGEPSWVFTTDDAPIWQAIASAPEGGRFALRTTSLTSADVSDDGHISPEQISKQVVHVYAFHDGIELLRIPLTPPQRPAQSFALAPDGLELAVLHNNELDTYKLPARSAAEEKELIREQQVLQKLDVPAEGEIDAKPQRHERK